MHRLCVSIVQSAECLFAVMYVVLESDSILELDSSPYFKDSDSDSDAKDSDSNPEDSDSSHQDSDCD